MRVAYLTQSYQFRALHRLPTCANSPKSKENIHGHDYKIEVTCAGEIDPTSGLILNRDQMNDIIRKTIIQKYDKTFLNNYFKFPTGELLCYSFFKQLSETSLSPLLQEVSLQETPKNLFRFSNSPKPFSP